MARYPRRGEWRPPTTKRSLRCIVCRAGHAGRLTVKTEPYRQDIYYVCHKHKDISLTELFEAYDRFADGFDGFSLACAHRVGARVGVHGLCSHKSAIGMVCDISTADNCPLWKPKGESDEQ